MESESFGRYISVIYRYVQMLLSFKLKPYGIGSGQYIFISTISQNEGISQKELSNIIKIDKTTTAKALRKLEENGYIYRIQDDEDRRYYKLYLTPKGIEFIPTLRKIQNELTNMLTIGMKESEYNEAMKYFDIILCNVQKAIEPLKIEE